MNSGNSATSSKKMIYWVTTIIVAAAFFLTGIGNLVHMAHIAQDMSRLGYPSYFLNILGAWKILGAIAIVLPGAPILKEWAYAGMAFDLTGAAFSRAFSGDPIIMVIVPVIIGIVVAASWALRPEKATLVHLARP